MTTPPEPETQEAGPGRILLLLLAAGAALAVGWGVLYAVMSFLGPGWG